MKNPIEITKGNKDQKSFLEELLHRIDADIVGEDGTLPTLEVTAISGFRSGGSITVNTDNSQKYFLETNDANVTYVPGRNHEKGKISYFEKYERRKKHAMYGWHFNIYVDLALQRKRPDPQE